MTRPRTLALIAAVAALGAAGCGSSEAIQLSNAPVAPAKPAASVKPPRVSFVVPRSGARTGRTIRVKVRLKNFVIDRKDVGKAPRPGYGHLHFVLDGGHYDYPRYSGANGRLGKVLGVAGQYSPSLTPSIVYCDIPPGRHKLEVYLANNNHTSTGVEAETTVTVRRASPSS